MVSFKQNNPMLRSLKMSFLSKLVVHFTPEQVTPIALAYRAIMERSIQMSIIEVIYAYLNLT